MASLGNFNANEHETNNFEPLPVGDYVAMITESEMKPTKTGGQYLKLTIEIVGDKFKGRKVFSNLNLKNSNAQAEDIAKRTLADICRAVGINNPRDSAELHMKPMVVSLVIRPATDQYPASNDVKGFKSIAKNPAPEQAKPAAAPETTGRKPWEQGEIV